MLASEDVMKRTGTLIVVLLALLAVAPAAQASAFKDIFGTYKKTGRVDGCKWSAQDLADAKRQVPNDIEQYAPDFPNALNDAIQKRAAGGCAKSAAAAPATTTPAGTSSGPTATTGVPPGTTPAPGGQAPQPTPTPNPAPAVADKAILAASRSRESDAGVPAPLVALAVIGALMALAALLYALARWWAWEPRWLVRARHAGAEAGWRASGSWAEFMDWVRLGR
jgi:hypothetical protein